MNEAWTGAWRWVSGNADGRPTITSTRYCYLVVRKNRSPATSTPLSDADAATLLRGILAAAGGTLETTVNGDEWSQIHTNFVALYPKDASSTVLRAVQVSGDDMAEQVLDPDGNVLDDNQYVRISHAGDSDLAGAWELRQSGRTGIVLFTDSRYQYLLTRDDRSPDTDSNSTDSELVELFRTTFAEAGNYRESEGSLLITPDIAMNPADQGSESSRPFRLNEGELEFEVGGQTLTWEKVE